MLFPVLALFLSIGLRRVFIDELPMAVFRVAIPVLVSLAVIRLTVKVLKAAFPHLAVRVVGRTVSWLVWLGTVLDHRGLAPHSDELDAITFKVGASRVSVRNLIEGALSAVLVLILSLVFVVGHQSRLLKGRATTSRCARSANAMRALLPLRLIMALSVAGI